MRPVPALIVLLLAGCGNPDEAVREPAKAADERIECATAGARSFDRVCTIERVQGPEGTTLIIRHPDGGFRRLLVTADGRGVIAADGADQAKVSVIGHNRIEVALGGDRYLLPATVKGTR